MLVSLQHLLVMLAHIWINQLAYYVLQEVIKVYLLSQALLVLLAQ